MNSETKMAIIGLGFVTVVLGFILLFYGTIGYIVIHFIRKLW